MGCCCTCCACCTCCGYCDDTDDTDSLNQLTKEQEVFLSSYKLIVYSSSIRASNFNLIEEEFEKKFNKKIDDEVLYKFYKI